jgi:hypothetical protein
MEMNQFADLTDGEFKMYLGLKLPQDYKERRQTEPFNAEAFQAPETVDWVARGRVQDVKN